MKIAKMMQRGAMIIIIKVFIVGFSETQRVRLCNVSSKELQWLLSLFGTRCVIVVKWIGS